MWPYSDPVPNRSAIQRQFVELGFAEKKKVKYSYPKKGKSTKNRLKGRIVKCPLCAVEVREAEFTHHYKKVHEKKALQEGRVSVSSLPNIKINSSKPSPRNPRPQVNRVLCSECGLIVRKDRLPSHITRVHNIKPIDIPVVKCLHCSSMVARNKFVHHLIETHNTPHVEAVRVYAESQGLVGPVATEQKERIIREENKSKERKLTRKEQHRKELESKKKRAEYAAKANTEAQVQKKVQKIKKMLSSPQRSQRKQEQVTAKEMGDLGNLVVQKYRKDERDIAREKNELKRGKTKELIGTTKESKQERVKYVAEIIERFEKSTTIESNSVNSEGET